MEQNSGENFSIRGRGPYELVYHKRFETLGDARQYERYLKPRKSSKYIARIIKNG